MLYNKVSKYPWVSVTVFIGLFVISWHGIKYYEISQLKKETLHVSNQLNGLIFDEISLNVDRINRLYQQITPQPGYPTSSTFINQLDGYFQQIHAVESMLFESTTAHDSTVLLNPYYTHDGHLMSKKECGTASAWTYQLMAISAPRDHLCLYNQSRDVTTILNVRMIIDHIFHQDISKGYFVAQFVRGAPLLENENAPWALTKDVHFGKASWTYVISPSAIYIETYLNHVPLFVLCLWSCLLGVLIGLDQLYQRYRVRQLRRYAVSDIRHLQQLAFYDPMTQLPNREALLVELNIILTRAKRHHLPFSLCFMDCDDFKKINDEAGHHVGDSVLKHVADVVLQNIRKNDFFARLSGDEFCLILEGTISDEAIHVVLTKLQHAISQPVEIAGYQTSVSVSIGVAVYPDAGTSVDALLMQADKAMYHAKRNQKGTYYITRNIVGHEGSSPELA